MKIYEYKGLIDRYQKYLPVNENTPIVTLHEGNTPLIRALNLEKVLGIAELYLKYEGMNPTGSFKDRGMTMAISKAAEDGVKAVICASTGNTSASAAAYAAKYGLKCVVVIPEGNIALGKLSQALVHGAQVIAINGNFDEALNLVKDITEKYPVVLVNSLNPFRIEGQKTGAFEIIDVLGNAPDYHFMPVGNAGNITAYWKGYNEYIEFGKSLPKMMGFQAEGSAPIVRGHVVEKPETVATAIRIGNPASWKQAEAARDESGGVIDMVSDDEILAAYKLLAKTEGVFCEPASASSIAGLKKYIEKGFFAGQDLTGKKIVCILTGHGLKDPDNAIKISSAVQSIDGKLDALVKTMGL
ncbi:threonine synthase [bacterium]